MTDPIDTAAARELADAATPAPWQFPKRGWPGVVMSRQGCLWDSRGRINDDADAEFIAHARELVPAMADEIDHRRHESAHFQREYDAACAENDALRTTINAALALHVVESYSTGAGDYYGACSACGYETDDMETDPCPTVRILDDEAADGGE